MAQPLSKISILEPLCWDSSVSAETLLPLVDGTVSSVGGFAMATSDKNTISLSEFYEENLYRLQDGVLNIVKNCGTPLYLIGGTIRCFLGHAGNNAGCV